MEDPPLTMEGKTLTIDKWRNSPIHYPTLLITSPLRRCLETALYAFHSQFNEGLRDFHADKRKLYEKMREYMASRGEWNDNAFGVA